MYFFISSLSLSRYTEEFVCSVVLGKDMIPRLSLVAMEDLKARVLRVIKDCYKPKVTNSLFEADSVCEMVK